MPAYPLGTKHHDYSESKHIPFEASQGGAHTMYPEYMKRLKELMHGAGIHVVGWHAMSPARASILAAAVAALATSAAR